MLGTQLNYCMIQNATLELHIRAAIHPTYTHSLLSIVHSTHKLLILCFNNTPYFSKRIYYSILLWCF